MFDPKLKTKLTIMLVLVVLLLLVVIDTGFKQQVTNQVGVVAVKKFASPQQSGDSIYMLVIVRDHQVWKARVERSYFHDVKENDRLYITRNVGRITGITYSAEIARILKQENIELKRAEVLQ